MVFNVVHYAWHNVYLSWLCHVSYNHMATLSSQNKDSTCRWCRLHSVALYVCFLQISNNIVIVAKLTFKLITLSFSSVVTINDQRCVEKFRYVEHHILSQTHEYNSVNQLYAVWLKNLTLRLTLTLGDNLANCRYRNSHACLHPFIRCQ